VNSINHSDKEVVKLEDPEFAKYFTVYSEDQVNARYILSTNLMRQLVNFKKKVRKNFYISFVEDMIYIAIEYPDGLFEPNLYRSMLRFAPLREYFEAIQLILGLVEELNLDRQIWKANE
jgi:ABC-type long-subunit fatty acid transport system fused permease/ATPase subunit